MTGNDLDEPNEDVLHQWETVVEEGDIAVSETITQATMASPVESFQRQTSSGTLPRISGDRQQDEFDVKTTIGQGGMGLVRLARQRSLWRDVAIKTILPEHVDETNIQNVLRESWVTGMLEHPNIVPIYALGLDENEAPMLVMKRIEGISWREALEGKSPMPEAFRGGRDEFEDHLQILIQVCHALQFAHSKDIIHCDLKPENVMLGDYGEVYLLDWGIAVCIGDDPTGRLPMASDIDGVSGTPAYIAPELAEGDGTNISERTDVYLLGGILHTIVTGEPRHSGQTVMATLINAYNSDPVDYGDDIPRELAAICNMATHVDPDQRFANVAAFRQAILEFLQHRDSRRLSDEANDRLEKLHRATIDVLDNTEYGNTDPDEDQLAEVHRLFTECRFGFEQALTVWSDNQRARRGLQRAVELMLDFELHQKNARAAALLLDDLPGDAPEYEQRLADLRRQLAEEAEEIERNRQFVRDIDISLASRQRSIMCIFLGLLFGTAPIIVHFFVGRGWAELTYSSYFTQFAAVIIGSGLVVGLMRERLLKNAINARLIASIFIILGGCLIMRVQAYLLGLGPEGAIALENGLLAFSMAMLALSIDRRVWPAGVAFLAGGIGGAIYPDYILTFDGASNALAIWIIAFVWWEPNPEPRRDR